MAHIRQSRPDSGLGFHVKVLKPFEVVPPSPGRGPGDLDHQEEDPHTHGALVEPFVDQKRGKLVRA